MEEDKKQPPTVTLETYVQILDRASKGNILLYHELSGADYYAARELKNSGFLSEGQVLGIAEAIVITPEGAMALESWSKYLAQETLRYKLKENLLRFMWVIVGALAASIGNYFS